MAIWIPVVGTLLGAGIGFGASILGVWLTKSKEEELARASRNRERIERIYQLLVTIRSERSSDLSEAILHIHSAGPIKPKEVSKLPALIELEMLTSLYFESLETRRVELIKSVHAFGAKYIEVCGKDYRQESQKQRQEDSGVLLSLHTKVDNQIKTMQKSLVSHAQA